MEITIVNEDEVLISLPEKLDFKQAPKLLELLSDLKGRELIKITFGCKNLTYLSSAGIRAIIFAQQKISKEMTIVMSSVCEDVLEVLDMCGISDFIEFTTS